MTFEYAGESDHCYYPIPPNPPIEGGDGHILMLDRDHWKLFELVGVKHQGTLERPGRVRPGPQFQRGPAAHLDLRGRGGPGDVPGPGAL